MTLRSSSRYVPSYPVSQQSTQGARHSGKDLAGTKKGNPTGMILSAVMMLRHLNLNGHADAIQKAVEDTIAAKVNLWFRIVLIMSRSM